MRIRQFTVSIVAIAAALAAGCAGGNARQLRTPTRDLLFGPKWAGIPTFDVPRPDWPATTSGPALDEKLEYRTTLYDLQGRFDRDDGTVYRRFRSVRTGSTTRPNQ